VLDGVCSDHLELVDCAALDLERGDGAALLKRLGAALGGN
jgi:hypothetical protein